MYLKKYDVSHMYSISVGNRKLLFGCTNFLKNFKFKYSIN